MGGLAASGVDASFDAYPYTRGCSILAMPILPASLTVRPTSEVLAVLADPDERAALLRDWFPTIVDYPSLGPDWPEMLTLAHVAAPEYAWTHGLTLGEASRRAGSDPATFALDVLAACRLEVNVVMAVRNERSPAELGVDPRAPARARRLRRHLRGRAPASSRARGRSPATCARSSSSRAHSRGRMPRPSSPRAQPSGSRSAGADASDRAGSPTSCSSTPTPCATARRTQEPLALAEGIDDVLVAGVPVLAGGALTGATPGRGIRRSRAGATATSSSTATTASTATSSTTSSTASTSITEEA